MRYSDKELFELDNNQLNSLKEQLRFNEFCLWAIGRLQYLIEDSTHCSDWMRNDINHLRNYRLKAIKFYEQKKGN
jgi:hypothetical protein